MARINEIKEQKIVVQSVGDFAGSLQQIAAARMVKLRKLVIASRRFVDEATLILRELQLAKMKVRHDLLNPKKSKMSKLTNKKKTEEEKPLFPERQAIIVISSNQGLAGSYNTEIIKKLENIALEHKEADFFVIGKKGQEFMARFSKKNNIQYFPFNIPEEVKMNDLKPLIGMFYYYNRIHLVYSKYINTTTREVVFLELAVPHTGQMDDDQIQDIDKYLFEPSVDELIQAISSQLRYALFRQQILDSKLSLYSAQMIAMQTASDNAKDLLKDLQMEYNKARRKLVDKKIQEVQAGRSLWDEE